MIDGALLVVVLAPALIAAGWTALALRTLGSRAWPTGALAALALAAALVLVAAFLPLPGVLALAGVPALSVAAGLVLQLAFARPLALGTALSAAFALFIALNEPSFPLVMPLVLSAPLWTVAWVDRDDQARTAAAFLASLVLVPAVVLGPLLLIRG